MKELRMIAMVSLISVASGYAMDDEKQLTTTMETLKVSESTDGCSSCPVPTVDAWGALDQTQRTNIVNTLLTMVEKQSDSSDKQDENSLKSSQGSVAVTRTYRDIRHKVRDDGASLPSTEQEYNEYLLPNIQWVKEHPDCTEDDISNMSDSSSEDADDGDKDWANDGDDEGK